MADAPNPAANATHPARREIQDLRDRLAAIDRPVLSLYLDVHADTDPNAPAQRADAALRELPLDRDVRERLERRVQTALREVGEGTLLYVADAEADGLQEAQLLRVAPPLPGGRHEAAARWGAPWLAPLDLLLAAEAPVVAAFADERRARVFVQDLGVVTEASAFVRSLDPSAWGRKAEHATGMPGRPARGGSGKDDFEARKEAWTARFVDEVAGELEAAVAAHERTRLVLLGEPKRVAQLEEALSKPVQERLLAKGPAPVDPDLGPARWSDPLATFVREKLHDEDEERLERLARDGVTGLGATLDPLQRGQLELVAVHADVDVDVVRCQDSGWLAEDEDHVRLVCPDGPIVREPLKEHLLEAVQRGRAQLRVLRGPDADALLERVGPIAGLPRRG
jgi:hypothetical protein